MIIDTITNHINQRFTNWSFIGSIVDLYYLKNIMVKDFDIITDEPFEPKHDGFWGPRTSFSCMGRLVDVFQDTPTSTKIPTIEEHLENLRWLVTFDTNRADKYLSLIERYENLQTPKVKQTKQVKELPVCQFLGEQVETMLCNVCGEGKGQEKPVFSCSIHCKCTPRQVRHGQKQLYDVHVCFGCDEGPENYK